MDEGGMDTGKILRTLVDLADTLVGDFEVHEFLQLLADRSLDVLGCEVGGVLVRGRDGTLEVAGASTRSMHGLELFELQRGQGPCWDAYRTGERVVAEDLSAELERWPQTAARALDLGFSAAVAQPLRLRDEILGALNLFRSERGGFDELQLSTVRAFADIATIGILQERAVADAERRAEQLQQALDSRIVIEQAKGFVAEQTGEDVQTAFELVRAHARRGNRKVRDVAQDIVDGRLSGGELRGRRAVSGPRGRD